MSIPYFVHKDDADKYDQREEELRPIRAAMNEAVRKELPSGLPFKDYHEKGDKIAAPFMLLLDTVWNKYGEIRTKSAFDKVDDKNWIVYFMGRRLDPEFGAKMMGVAEDGIDGIEKVLKGE